MTCKSCTECGVLMSLDYFGERKSDGRLRHYSACRACMRERWKRWNRKVRQPPAVRGFVPPTDFLPMPLPVDRNVPLRWAA